MRPRFCPPTVPLVCAAASLLLAAFAAPAQAQYDCTTRVPACQTPANPNSTPKIIISPEHAASTNASVTVTITWADEGGLDAGTRAVLVDNSNVTNSFTWVPTTMQGVIRAASSTATLTLGVGEHIVNAQINDASGAQGSAFGTITVLAPQVGLRVSPLVLLTPHHSGYRDVGTGAATYRYEAPSYVSLDQARSLGLTYAGGMARAMGLVQVDVMDGSSDPPTKMSIQLIDLNGTRVTFPGGLQEIFYAAGPGTNRLAAQFDATSLPTAAHSFDVVVRSWRADGSFVEAAPRRVRVPIVNRGTSPYGAGWTVSGLQTLRNQGDGVFITEGSTGLWFAKDTCTSNGDCSYTAPDGDFTTVKWIDAHGVWTRRYKDGTVARFGWNGVMLDVTDRYGNLTVFGYDGAGRVTTITDAAGLVSHFGYRPDDPAYGGTSGRLAWFEDPMGRRTTVELAGAGELFRIWNPAGQQVLQASYANNHLLEYYYDISGGLNSFYYDSGNFTLNGMETPPVQTDSGVVRVGAGFRSLESAVLNQPGVNGSAATPAPYRASGSVRVIQWDARGNHTDMAVDRFGNPTRVEAPTGIVTTIERDGVTGLPTLERSSSGGLVTYDWDAQGNLRNYVDPSSGIGYYVEYGTPFNLPTLVLNGTSGTTYRYGTLGQLLSSQTSGESTTYTYNSAIRLETITDMAGHQVEIAYEGTGSKNTSRVIQPSANGRDTMTYFYDGVGRNRKVRAANGDTTTTAYDVLNRVVSTTDAAGRTTTFSYPSVFLFSVTDPAGKSYFSRFNALGWKVADSIPGRPTSYVGYNRLGQVTSGTDRRGSTVRFTRDLLGRVLTRTADGQTTTFSYGTGNSFMTAANAESIDTLRYDFDTGQLQSRVSILGGKRYELNYTFTGEGSVLNVALNAYLGGQTPLTRDVWYYPDGRMRPYAIKDLSGQDTEIRFNSEGLTSSITYPGGLQQAFTYTPSHALAAQSWNNSAMQNVLGATYDYDHRGRLTAGPQRGPVSDRIQRTYRYDLANQLLGYQDRLIKKRTVCADRSCRTYVDTSTLSMPADTFGYDAAGNRTDRGATVQAGTNRYLTFDGYQFEYDGEGNLLRKAKPGYDDLTITWNSLGQIASAWRSQRGTVQYGYNGFGERVRRTAPDGTVTRYLYDRDDLLMELDNSGNPVREYTYFPGVDQPHSVRITPPGQTAQTYYYSMEQPGHVTGLVNGAGTVVNQYAYSPFGVTTSATEGVAQPLRYMAREFDAVSGLYYVRARWYDPEQGRFASEDPIGLAGGMNMYSYIGNSPTNGTDPSGMCPPGTTRQRVRKQQPDGSWAIGSSCFQPDGTNLGWELEELIANGGRTMIFLMSDLGYSRYFSFQQGPPSSPIRSGMGGGTPLTAAQRATVKKECSAEAFRAARFNGMVNVGSLGAVTGAIGGGIVGYTGGRMVGGVTGFAIGLASGGAPAAVTWLAGDFLGGAIGAGLGATLGAVHGAFVGGAEGWVMGQAEQLVQCARARSGAPVP